MVALETEAQLVTETELEPVGLAARLWEHTRTWHIKAEQSGVVAEMFHGRCSSFHYGLFLRNLLPVYVMLEEQLQRHRHLPALRLFALPATYRATSLRSDLEALMGHDWEAVLPLLPEASGYATHLRLIAPARLIAHAYTRYLGDLSGGQILQKLLARTLGLSPSQLGFYAFPAIDDLGAFKVGYRARLDAAGRELVDVQAVIDEAEVAFRLNIALSDAVMTSSLKEH